MDVEDLEVYRESMRITEKSWRKIFQWNFFARDTGEKQLVRCADSIAANISEGVGSCRYAENRKFCFCARGSQQETLSFVQKVKNRNLVFPDKGTTLCNEPATLRKRVNANIWMIGPTNEAP